MMNKIILMVVTLLIGYQSYADYSPLQLYEMILDADKVVYGEIIKIDSFHFTLSIERSLDADTGTLEIEKFIDWACAVRWTKYRIGQRVLLFLKENNGTLSVMSAGNEGELPIVENTVYINSMSYYKIAFEQEASGKVDTIEPLSWPPSGFNIYGSLFSGCQWELNSFLESVSFIRDCFSYNRPKIHSESAKWSLNCEPETIEQTRKNSALVNWVCLEIEKTRDN